MLFPEKLAVLVDKTHGARALMQVIACNVAVLGSWETLKKDPERRTGVRSGR